MLPPHGRVVVAGFSQGAWLALYIAMEGQLVISGSAVMVAPFAGAEPYQRAWRRLKVSVLIGEKDVRLRRATLRAPQAIETTSMKSSSQ